MIVEEWYNSRIQLDNTQQQSNYKSHTRMFLTNIPLSCCKYRSWFTK